MITLPQLILYLYLTIGSIIAYVVWKVDAKQEYEELKEHEDVNDSIVIGYLMTIIILWPLKILLDIIRKD